MENSDLGRFDSPIQKVDDDRRLVFGWANVQKTDDGNVVKDSQGDIIDTPEAIEAFEHAVYEFVLKFRSGDEEHVRFDIANLVESIMFTVEKREAMGIPDGVLPEAAWWVGFHVPDDAAWKGIKDGRLRMFSIVGQGRREVVDA